MFSRKLYATGSATADAVSTITVPSASRILAVQWTINFDSITDNGIATVEFSAAPKTEIASASAQQCISEIRFQSNFVTSGLSVGGLNLWVPIPMVPCSQGQLLYMHVVISGTVTYTGGAVVWFT